VSEDASAYTLMVRPGVTWSNGDAFTAEDVAFNLRADVRRELGRGQRASRLAVRCATLTAETGQARDGAIEVVDDHDGAF
jgi:peptide/nickel transport system substrate-binding protein